MTPLRARLAPAAGTLAACTLAAGLLLATPTPAFAAGAAPAVPDRLGISGVRCAAGDGTFIGTTSPELTAVVDDPDFGRSLEQVTPTFAYWPVDRPGERTEQDGVPVGSAELVRLRVPNPLANGAAYAFSVRATDATGNRSAWSAECRFSVDTTVPRRPAVTSADYPSTIGTAHGGPGIPGQFTFAAAAEDTDVVSFRVNETTVVPVGADGTATYEYTPTRYGSHTLSVAAVDRTRNRSAPTEYTFMVARTEPEVTDHHPEAGFGAPRTITFAPRMADTTRYTYWLNDGAQTTADADADGTATVVVTPDRPGGNVLHVVGHTSSGRSSDDTAALLHVRTAPTVTSPDFPGDDSEPPLVGHEVTVTLGPGMPGVTGYIWSASDGEEHVLDANPDGTATLRWKSRDHGTLALSVRSRTADGTESETAYVWWNLTVHNPAVDSAEYPEYQTAGGPGVTGTFVFRPARPGVTAYTYAFDTDEDEERTIPADADGTARLTWTPTAEDTGRRTLQVREHIGNAVSNATEYSFRVAD